MNDIEARDEKKPMKQLSELWKDEKIARCSCGSAAFFDCGVEILDTATGYTSPRYADYADRNHVKICVDCRKAVVIHGGDLYDASEYIGADQIEKHMRWRRQATETDPGVLKRAT